jgi:hypothetical protein
MIAVSNKVIPVITRNARINKADRVVKQAQEEVIPETRDSKVEQVGAISRANRVSKVNRKVGLIVIARDNKVICPIVTVGRPSKKKLLQIAVIHLMMMTRTQTNPKTKLQTGMRIRTAA